MPLAIAVPHVQRYVRALRPGTETTPRVRRLSATWLLRHAPLNEAMEAILSTPYVDTGVPMADRARLVGVVMTSCRLEVAISAAAVDVDRHDLVEVLVRHLQPLIDHEAG